MLMPSKPFNVTFGDLRLRFEPDHEAGGYVVRALNREGVFSQGDTFEEALEMILEVDHLMAEHRNAQRLGEAAKKHPRRTLAPSGK